ncbi:MAG: hypothetical protein R3D25_11345 [Geminicoccaceae bacterium]
MEKPTAMSTGRSGSCQISTTGTPRPRVARSSRRRAAGVCCPALSTSPPGRRPSTARRSASSLEEEYSVVPSRSSWPASRSTAPSPAMVEAKIEPARVETSAATSRLCRDASAPAAASGT